MHDIRGESGIVGIKYSTSFDARQWRNLMPLTEAIKRIERYNLMLTICTINEIFSNKMCASLEREKLETIRSRFVACSSKDLTMLNRYESAFHHAVPYDYVA
jgi:hypothetical protein